MTEDAGATDRTGIEIAVIGMAGRFPRAKNIGEFWENLKNGVESISFLSAEEINESEEAQQLKSNPNYVNSKGGVLENMEYFDAHFFGYTPLEAEIMDPQVRIFLECTWEALENAGYAPGYYTGLIGLYAGAASHFNWEVLCRLSGKDAEMGEFTALLLADSSFLSTSVSYKLGLKGPAIFVRSACSTSLVAIHLASQAILSGECDMALAGGVSVNSLEKVGYIYKEGMINSADGRCRAFDANASGCIGGSGAGVVVLKLLDDARQDRDHIHAVIKGSAVNNDGNRKSGYTAPSVEGQSEVIIAAHQVSEVPPETITYVETHGTGTILGDPIEIEALKKGFKTDKKNFCAIGAVKPNVGHLNTAAGITGFIKTVLALTHRQIPPSLNFQTPNPEIDFENSPFFVNKTLREWKSNGNPLRAGVSSFGIGGTNAHVVLEEWPGQGRGGVSPLGQTRENHLILLSAKTETALEKVTGNLIEYLRDEPGQGLEDVAYTLQVGRRGLEYRRVSVCTTTAETIEKLSTPGAGGVYTGRVRKEKPQVVFMFSGLGSQYVNMGRELYEKEPVFRDQMNRCFEILEPLLEYDLKETLYPGSDESDQSDRSDRSDRSGLNPIEIAQPAIFSFEYALAKLLINWGIKPQAMIGYSFGEISAACTAGVFSLEEALKMIVTRGKLIQTLPAGAMSSIPLPYQEVKPFIPAGVSIAIDNGQSCIAAGSAASIAALEEKMKKKGLICMRLQTSAAVHSEMMDPILKEFENRLKMLEMQDPQIPFISNVTGTWITADDAKNPAYWKRHLRETVRFSDGIKELLNKENVIFIEIGPGRDICALLGRYLENKPGKPVINLTRQSTQKESEVFYLLNKIGILWLWGVKIDWNRFNPGEKRNRIPLPTYPFERQRYWIDVDLFNPGTGINREKPRTRSAAEMSDWFYIPSWKRYTSYPESQKIGKKSQKYNWLVFVNDMNPGKLIVDRLESEGHTVVVVKPGSVYARRDEKTYIVNPGENGQYGKLFDELQRMQVFPDKIIHGWGQTGENNNCPGMESFEGVQGYVYYSLLYIVQAIGKKNFTNSIEITVLTDGLHEVVGGEPLNPAKSTVLGLIGSIPQENPGLRCVGIDIILPEPGTSEEEALIDTLWRELTGGGGHEPVKAIRNHNIWVRVFEPIHLGPERKEYARLREKGVYLITGGMGKIGLMFAELLARRVKARLVLTGRTPYPPQDEFKIKKLRQVEALGGQVLYIRAEASDLEQMRDVIRRTGQTYGKINGVIHCAGIADGRAMRMIQDLTPGDSRRQFQAKVYGALVLEELFKTEELDFAWMMSSVSCILGGLGFAAYAAANIFMDTLVRRRNRLEKNRQPWLSLNWDGIEAEKSIDIFERLLSLEKPDQVIFSSGGNLQERYDRWIKLEQVKNQVHASDQKEHKPKGHPRPFLTEKYVPPQNLEEREITAVWERILGIEGIGANDNFLELGGDSLKAITILAVIQKKMNAKVPLAEMFKSPTIRELSAAIKKSAGEKYAAIEPAEKKEYYPLSSAQKRIFILQQMSLNSTAYNISQIIPLTAGFAGEKIEATFKKLINRHESLRTSFHMVNDTPVQRVREGMTFNLQVHDVNGPHAAWDFIKGFIGPFDLSRAPLLRAGRLKDGKNRPLLIVDMHHIISDGVSCDILAKDFQDLYNEKEITPLALQYKDFSQWQNKEIEKGKLKPQEEFWKKEFAGEIPVLELPYDYPRPVVQSFEGSRVSSGITGEQTRALNGMALEGGATLFMVLTALLNILLSKLSGQEEIIMGTPVAGRRHADLEKIIGIFVNTLPLKNDPAGNRTVKEFLGDVKEKMLQASENQEYPFEDLVDKLLVERDIGRNPLFDVMFSYQDMKTGNAGQDKETELQTGQPVPGSKPADAKPGYEIPETAKFDLAITSFESDSGLFLSFSYCTELFKRETVERFIVYFKKIISIAIKDPGIRIGEIRIISEEEKKQMLFDFNETRTGNPEDKTIHRLFAEQVERTPGNIALHGSMLAWKQGKEEERKLRSEEHKQEGESQPDRPVQLTYRELNEKSGRLANALIEKGVQPETIVGIKVERSVEMVVGILGILKAGGAYMPVEPGYPPERIEYMLKDSGTTILMTAPIIEEVLNRSNMSYMSNLSNLSDLSNLSNLSNLSGKATTMAYIIYTSGTTGRPKGTIIGHGNVVRLMKNDKLPFDFDHRDNWTMFHSYCFDFSVWEMYGALLNGGKLMVISKMITRDMGSYLDILKKMCVTVINQTPSAFSILSGLELDSPGSELSTRYVIFGGEALKPSTLKDWKSKYPGTKLINMYGITETTVHVTFKELTDRDIESNTGNIGKPIPALTVYVMDKNLRMQPVGVAGELCVGGEGVARGYLNRPGLTGEKFVENPYQAGERLYKSGDLVKQDSTGDLYYLGRIDHQVKIRGYRIELGEIESRLVKISGIKEAVVLAIGQGKADKHICAYFVSEREYEPSELRDYLAKELPEYMIPSYFVPMEAIPLTPNGKVDRKALPAPVIKAKEAYIAPGNDLEEKLAGIWAEILGIEKGIISMDSNFFAIGGHSLNAAVMVTKIHKELNKVIALTEIFKSPTIRGIASLIDIIQWAEDKEKNIAGVQPREEIEL